MLPLFARFNRFQCDRSMAWVSARNSGVDAKALLQGLMTNDMSLLDDGEGRRPCISAAFLNPKVRQQVSPHAEKDVERLLP